MPPPCCMVSAASRRLAKMPPMSSGIVPMTKQLNRVTVRPVPAPARMRPAGRNWKSVSASANRPVHSAGWPPASAKRFRDARPGVADGFVHRLAVEHLQPVFHIPDLLGYGCYGRHSALPYTVLSRMDRTAEYLQKQEFPRSEPLVRRTLRRPDIPFKQQWFSFCSKFERAKASVSKDGFVLQSVHKPPQRQRVDPQSFPQAKKLMARLRALHWAAAWMA